MGNQGASNSGMVKVKEWFDAGLIGNVDEVFVWTNGLYGHKVFQFQNLMEVLFLKVLIGIFGLGPLQK